VNKFNITKQGKDYDAQGDYVRTWVPELKNVPASHIHEPWAMSKAAMEQSDCQIGTDYPAPLAPPRREHRAAGRHEGGGRGRGGRGGRNGGRVDFDRRVRGSNAH